VLALTSDMRQRRDRHSGQEIPQHHPPAPVRDLYGTMLHEGATKGILVTTAEFGPSAQEFAAGKPLTLLGGRQLADLLARHGIGQYAPHA